MANFYVKNEQLVNFTLSLQKINDIALPIAVQNTLNAVAKDVKLRTLEKSTNKEFDVRKKTFFKANSGFKAHKAKEFNYNVNRVKAEVGMVKGKRANEKATEQIGHQQTAKPVKRSINPLGDKPLTAKTVDILSKKPVIYDSESNYSEGNSIVYTRRAEKAYRNRSGFLVKKGPRGAVNEVKSIGKRKPTKTDSRKSIIKVKAIASYKQSGTVDLKKERPFLDNAVKRSGKDILEQAFIKEAEKQITRAMKG